MELGLINSITTPLKIENNYDVSKFTNISNDKINAIIHQTKIDKMENKEIKNEVVENVETTKEIQMIQR